MIPPARMCGLATWRRCSATNLSPVNASRNKETTSTLDPHFRAIGARVLVRPARWNTRINVETDRRGEHFVVDLADDAEALPLEVSRDLRHLVLLVRRRDGRQVINSRFLCGHDERHLFVAAVPEHSPTSTVRGAMEALKPAELRSVPVRKAQRTRRKTDAYRRQGEWFFVPAPEFDPGDAQILRNEPIRRSAGKPHFCGELVRHGGEQVYVNSRHPNGLTRREHDELVRSGGADHEPPFRVMTRAAEVLVRGRVSHADHATITLRGWHRVLVNSEHESRARANVAFLD